MNRIHNLSTNVSLITEWINELRNVECQNQRMVFRRNLERIGEIAAYEISKTLDYKEVNVQTPLANKASKTLESQPVVMTILRAGVPLFNGVMNYFDKADAGFVAAYRKENGSEISVRQEYVTCPNIAGRPLIVTDPMLATGSSLKEALNEILEIGEPSSLHFICAIAAQEGVDFIKNEFPQMEIWCGTIDPSLDDKKYIVPGLGDAGDLSFGNKLQNS
ncbi:MAG: uracil phosphoribosyltransferase [Weeksellaceae bacterium]